MSLETSVNNKPLDLLTRFAFESKLCPGVKVVFRRVSVVAREKFVSALATMQVELRRLYRERKPLDDEREASVKRAEAQAKKEVDRLIEAEQLTREEAEKRVRLDLDLPEAKLTEWAALTLQIQKIERQGEATAMLRALLVLVEGLMLDGKPATPETLIESGDGELTDELAEVAKQIAGLSPTERGESPWPGTSQLPKAGPTTSTTAPPAKDEPLQAA